ncbi:MFS transporter [Nonomuraea sp. M3C6]|uniref:MFS transporter n=1 Tax=Nonomuraea marmarensis TaxID=3351344 RepID=A0ABW7AZ30_9ACTN
MANTPSPRPPTGGPHPCPADRRRWLVLTVGMLAMTAGCTFQFGLAYLIPALRAEGLSLAEAGLLAAAPNAGLLATLIAWGAAADRWGERIVLSSGLGLAGIVLLTAATVHDPIALGVCFLLAGAAGASVHASSGRLIMGWFAAAERGLAMGIRQTAQPLGVAVAALTLPSLAATHATPAVVFMSAFCLVAAVLVVALVRDPQRGTHTAAQRTGSPYRTPVLWRIHAASALLIVPQFTVATFALVFLVDAQHFDPATAGRVLAAGQVGGAIARLATGWWSDRVGSRLRPMRITALAVAAVVAVLAATTHSPIAVAVLLIAAIVTVSPNGLAFTAVAEHAGRAWSGRALGIQNTAQNAVASATPPILGAVITGVGYGPAFAAILAFPLLAAALIPTRAEDTNPYPPTPPPARPRPVRPGRSSPPADRLS